MSTSKNDVVLIIIENTKVGSSDEDAVRILSGSLTALLFQTSIVSIDASAVGIGWDIVSVTCGMSSWLLMVASIAGKLENESCNVLTNRECS